MKTQLLGMHGRRCAMLTEPHPQHAGPPERAFVLSRQHKTNGEDEGPLPCAVLSIQSSWTWVAVRDPTFRSVGEKTEGNQSLLVSV